MENKKETVTLAQINHELKKDILGGFVLVCIIPAFFYGLILMVSMIYNAIIVTVFKIIALSAFLACLFLLVRAAIKLRNGTYFTVRTDVLVRSVDGVFQARWRDSNRCQYRLYFNRGHYDIPRGPHYRWTDISEMNAETIYDTAFSGDTFTLVEDGKQVLMVFNHRFFDVEI